jgi:hypothetical protein
MMQAGMISPMVPLPNHAECEKFASVTLILQDMAMLCR